MDEDYLASVTGGGGSGMGGLLGFLRDPSAMAYLGMIAKGLSPWSDINPQQMLAQAHRLKQVEEERRIRALERKQDQDNWNRRFGLDSARDSREERRIGIAEAAEARKAQLEEAQRRAEEGAGRLLSEPPPQSPPVVPTTTGFDQRFRGSDPDANINVPNPVTTGMDWAGREKQILDYFAKFPRAASSPAGKLLQDELARVRERIEGKPMPAEVTARVALADSYLDKAPSLREAITRGDLTGPLDQPRARFGIGDRGQRYAEIESGVDALRRGLTGAGMPASEAADYARRYLPTITDTADTLAQKHDRLVDELQRFKSNTEQGRGRASSGNRPRPNPTLDEARSAIARGAPREKVIQRLRQMGIDSSGL